MGGKGKRSAAKGVNVEARRVAHFISPIIQITLPPSFPITLARSQLFCTPPHANAQAKVKEHHKVRTAQQRSLILLDLIEYVVKD